MACKVSFTRVLRDVRSGYFLQLDGTWTDDPTGAVHFSTSDDAMGICKVYNLSGTELVYRFGDGLKDIAVPIC